MGVGLSEIGQQRRIRIGRDPELGEIAWPGGGKEHRQNPAAQHPDQYKAEEEAGALGAGIGDEGIIGPDHIHHHEPHVIIQVDEEGDGPVAEKRLQQLPRPVTEMQRQVPVVEGLVPGERIDHRHIGFEHGEDIHEDDQRQCGGQAVGHAPRIAQNRFHPPPQCKDGTIRRLEDRHLGEQIDDQSQQHGRHREEHDAEEDFTARLGAHAGHERMQQNETRHMREGRQQQQPMGVETEAQQRPESAASSVRRQTCRSGSQLHAQFLNVHAFETRQIAADNGSSGLRLVKSRGPCGKPCGKPKRNRLVTGPDN